MQLAQSPSAYASTACRFVSRRVHTYLYVYDGSNASDHQVLNLAVEHQIGARLASDRGPCLRKVTEGVVDGHVLVGEEQHLELWGV